jgi:tetratricopeptide (TPR) repeat protein
MEGSRWQTIAAIAEQALALEGDARAELVAVESARRPELAGDLAGVVRAFDGAESFVEGLSRQLGDLLDPLGLRPGDELGAYRIERALGSGGMGAVYLARRADDQFDKTVAIKVLPSTLPAADERRRFLEERQILAGLEHPAIARLLDGGVSPAGQPYFVLEYVQGSTIDDHADRARLDQVLDVYLQICGAVAHAHGRLIIHCDIKPANVLVTVGGEVKLLDFGVARMMSEPKERGRFGTLHTPVTRNYAAPELLAGRAVDTRADVYSLGVLLHRLLTGHQPYSLPIGSLDQLAAAVAGVSIPSLERAGKLAGASPLEVAELDAIIARATARDPDARTTSARDLADQIGRVRDRQPLPVPPPGVRAYRLRKAMRRNPMAAALAVTTAFLAAASIAALGTGLVVARAERQRAEVASQRAMRESQTAGQVIELLVSIFDAADPELRTAGASPVTARELLDSGLARIQHAEITSPEVSARLGLTIGRIARKLGDYGSAERALARATAAGVDDALRNQALLELGLAQSARGDHEAARANLDLAFEGCAAAGDERCALEALRTSGDMAIQRGDIASARASLAEAIERGARLRPATRQDRGFLALTTYGLAVAAHKAGDLGEATRLFGESQRLFRELEGQPTVEAANSYLTLATVKSARGEYRDALPLLEQARSILLDLYGGRHLRVAYLDFVAADVHARLGDHEGALAAAQHALAVRREVLGESHGDTGMAWGRVGDALAGLGRDAEALAAAERSRAINRTAQPTSHANVGLLVARLQARLGRTALAIATARESLAFFEKEFGPGHAMALRGHAAVAQALASSGDVAAALTSQQRALAIADSTLRPDHPRRVGLLVDLGDLEGRAGQADAARATLELATGLAGEAYPPQPEMAARARALLADLPR